MSFLSDLFHGNTGNLANDLAPSNIFSDAGSDFSNQPTWAKGLELAAPLAIGAVATGGADLAGLPALFGADAAAGGATAAADTGFDLATIGPGVADAGTAVAGADAASGGLDLTALGLSADTGGSALAADPGIAAINAAAPASGQAIDTAGLSGLTPGDVSYFSPTGADAASYGAAPADSSSFLDKLVTGASNSITKNPLGIAVAGGALAYDVAKGNPDSANVNALKTDAANLSGQAGALTASGQQLTQYLQNGTLPPGQQAQVNQAVAAAKARIISNAAANGQNTNPSQNSALAQDLANADLEGLSLAGQFETQLAATGTTLINAGLNATGLSSQIYETLTKIDQANNTQLMQSIAAMAAALGGGTKIQIGGNSAAA